MILKKNKNTLRPLFTVFALLTTMLWWGANTTSAQTPAARGTLYDFNGSGRTSFVTLSFPASGNIRWRIQGNPQAPGPNQAFIREFDYGLATNNSDSIVPEDYTGDLKTEPTVWRRTNGTFYVAQSPTGPSGITLERAVQWGAPGDDPRGVGDYDADGKADYTVVRNVEGTLTWYIMSSRTGTMSAIRFGSITGLAPRDDGGFTIFPGADFDADGRDELIFVTGTADQDRNTYFIGNAVTGQGVITRDFGRFATDISVAPDDYTGDGRADFVAVRQPFPVDGTPEIWFILNVAANTVTATRFGIADIRFTVNDQPVRGDYDGDKRHDIAVYRESNQTFYWINSSNGTIGGQMVGSNPGDIPLGTIDTF